MQDINRNIGQTLKRIRAEKGWSLDQTSKQTGVSKAMLGQIERGESSPTVATLWKIAGGFHISLSTLIEPAQEQEAGYQEADIRIRSAEQLRRRPAQDSMLVASLFPYEDSVGFEMYELTLLPGYERIAEPHESGVTEHVVVLSGCLELLVNGQWRELKQGDAIRFAADKPHGYRNLNEQPAVFHDVIHYQHQKSEC
ncbi:helix-turn-helix domain-containing protein [Oceanospirillum beijerinckii]|uniref:helix-turn-helix domain-containing protein n=1 Tax=Oceanospirillum beijerinckii TaxID=64976 RepID=UPI00041C5CB0|nr:XRE family transcriptional regulator [Oceanospirillum beijerinckii]